MSGRESPTAVPDSSVPGEAATIAGSVIESLREKGRIRTALQLELGDARDAGEDPKPGDGAVRDALGRYSVLGEIARGGVGIVLRGRDADLGRDVAVKVLRDEHLANDSVLQRFIEEAQIGAQMQHPGIVPVYEMGLASGDRPYFSMKLVKGETLAARLSARESLEDGRRKLVGIFEAVCATMAYAHARGVVHRDLKPSNIMIGSHGQILVVDWGLAKVRGRGGVADEREARRAQQPKTIIATVRSETTGSESMVGSVMGTPGYMPPEQARGDVDQMDERSDVFALGAILCEILTGSPPYVGKDMDMVMMAARAELDGARKRLGECGADAPLVNLALKCLAPSPLDRPRDAREVHAALRAHESKIAARAQQARRAAVEASIRAAEARRSRRLTNVLVATVLGAVVVLGGGGFAYSAARSSRLAEVREQVGAAMAEAAEAQGRATSTHDVSDWSAARLAARRALEIAQAGEADAETLGAAETLVANVEAAEREALDEDEGRRRDRELTDALDSIRLAAWDLDPAALDKAYIAAFEAYGVDPVAIDAAGDRLAASRIAARIASGLSAWADARRDAGGDDSGLRALVARVDTDPWHANLRAAATLGELRSLVAAADVDTLPVESVGRLVERLAAAGDTNAAIDVAERATRIHPHDPWLRSQLSILLLDLPVARTSAALGHSAVLTSLLPRAASAWASRAHVLQSAGRSLEALEAANHAIELNPASAPGRAQLARVHVALDDPESAERELDKALELDPDLALAHLERARLVADGGDRKVAQEHFERALELEPNSARAHTVYGTYMAELGRFDLAVASLERALEIDPAYTTARGRLAEMRLAICDDEQAARHLEAYLEARPASTGHMSLLAQCLGRIGDAEGSRDVLDAILRLSPTSTQPLLEAAEMRMRLGELDDAERLIGRATLSGGASFVAGDLLLATLLVQRLRRLPDDRIEESYDALTVLLDGVTLRARTQAETLGAAKRLTARAYQRRGLVTRSVKQLETALDAATSVAGRRQVEGEIELARRLKLLAYMPKRTKAAIGGGTFEPESAAQAMDCAQFCDRQSYYVAAAHYCETAFDLEPGLAEDLESRNRLRAAWCAARASAGHGNLPEGLTDRDRSRLRRRALDWLRDELFARRSHFESDPDHNWATTLSWILRVYADLDLAVVRATSELARVSDAERGAFERFWADVDQLRRDVATHVDDRLLGADDVLRFFEESADEHNLVWVAARIDTVTSRLKGRRWGAEQLTGPPTSPFAAQWPGSWCASKQDAGEEWIELVYDVAVVPDSVEVHETSSAGAITRIQVREPDGEWQTVWEGAPKPALSHRVFRPRLRALDTPITEVRIELDTSRVPGWEHIDCVELVGSGRRQWAREARVSSDGADL